MEVPSWVNTPAKRDTWSFYFDTTYNYKEAIKKNKCFTPVEYISGQYKMTEEEFELTNGGAF